MSFYPGRTSGDASSELSRWISQFELLPEASLAVAVTAAPAAERAEGVQCTSGGGRKAASSIGPAQYPVLKSMMARLRWIGSAGSSGMLCVYQCCTSGWLPSASLVDERSHV